MSAHRGGKEGAQPETMAAFRQALSDGIRDLEFDVRYSRDGVAIVSHDEQPAGMASKIQLATGAQARAAGRLTLSDLVALTKSYPTLRLRPEVKTYPGQTNASKRTDAKRLATAVKSAGLATRATIQSLDFDVTTATIKQVDSRIRVQALVRTVSLSQVRLAHAAKADEISYNATDGATKYANDLAHEYGMKVVPWWLRNEGNYTYAKAVALGADMVITDYPAAAAASIANPRCQIKTVDIPDKQVFSGMLRAGTRVYPAVIGAGKVPAAKDLVSVQVRFNKTSGTGTLNAAPLNSRMVDGTAVPLSAKRSYDFSTTAGDGGKLRVMSNRTITGSLLITGYQVMSCAN